MALIRQRKGGSWEIIIQRKGLLPKPHYASANTEAEAREYAAGVERLLDQGVLPDSLAPAPADSAVLRDWARQYLASVAAVSNADRDVLESMWDQLALWPVSRLTGEWAENWVADMKSKRLAPSTIRHKSGAVRRLLDWALRKKMLQVNPFAFLPKKFASYAPADGIAVEDVERDRRLLPGEYERLMRILDGEMPEGKQRGLVSTDRAGRRLLFILACESAMRLREMFTLEPRQVDLGKRTIFLEKTKNGDKRQVPLSSIAVAELAAWPMDDEFVFPWFKGDYSHSGLKKMSTHISQKWRTVARLAGCEDLRFHDLRHEAVCRLYERTTLGDVQIARITGHRDLKMLKRYSNLRGSDLAERLW